MTKDRRSILIGLLLTLLVLVIDQASKWIILENFSYGSAPAMDITPFFSLVVVWNYGVSFGMLASQQQPFALIGISAVICFILLIWLYKCNSRWVGFALGCIMGGAVGNVIDRLRFGAVADFLDFHIGQLHWPAFNIADSGIFIGVVLLCWHSMFIERHQASKGSTS